MRPFFVHVAVGNAVGTVRLGKWNVRENRFTVVFERMKGDSSG